MRQCMYTFNEVVKAYINLVDTMTNGVVNNYAPDPPKTIKKAAQSQKNTKEL